MSGMLPMIGLGLLLVLGIAMMVLGMRSSSQPDAINDRLSQFTERTMTLEEMELAQPFSQRVIVPMMRGVLLKLGESGPQQSMERMRNNIAMAGNPAGLTPTMFVGVRISLALVLALAFGGIGFLTSATDPLNPGNAPISALIGAGLGLVLGYLLPSMWLGQQIGKRKKAITKALPDALDLLCICVEAGLSFDQATQRLVEKWDDPLTREFRRTLSDTRLGRPRRDAMKDMITRCGVDDVQTFLGAVIQAEQLGVSIGRILKIQSDQMRLRRRQRAEEEAHKAPIKMLFPMVFLIFPSLFVVILGPSIPRLMASGFA